MKPDQMEIENMAANLSKARAIMGFSNAEVGRIAGVDPSQVSRICKGEFRTYSNNVVQVCKVLGIQVDSVVRRSQKSDAVSAQLENSVRRLVSSRPEVAEGVMKILDSLTELGVDPK